MKLFDFRIGPYFPERGQYAGAIVLFLSALFLMYRPVVGMIMFLVAIVILTTHYRLAIDPVKKTFRDYVWILGLKSGGPESFFEIQYVYITQNKERASGMVLRPGILVDDPYAVWDGYLKFSDDQKVHLGTRKRKQRMIRLVKKIASPLKLKIIDYSDGHPEEIPL